MTEISIPTQRYGLNTNGSLYAVAIAETVGGPAPKQRIFTAAPLTHYGYPDAEKIGLFGNGDDDAGSNTARTEERPVNFWHGNLTLHAVADRTVYPRHGVPNDVLPFYRIDEKSGGFFPALYIESLSVLHKRSTPLHRIKGNKVRLNITLSPITLGRWRLYSQMERSLEGVKQQWGFGDGDIDQIKQLFCYTNHVLLGATLAVSVLHSLFSFLAMKNDVMYWSRRDSMLGLSASQVVFECFASFVVFLYLLDSDKGNKIVNFLCACECAIAAWKLARMVKMRRTANATRTEMQTSEYDAIAIRYLGGALLPFVIAYCGYSLVYDEHKGFYSWLIASLASVVYAVGFILMTPQLFINYKLKSVAHLPWRTLWYKAFNTFVDDLFSLVIDMPMLHRLACFRDDVVFFIFLYQWWLYGSDKKRSFELDDEASEETKDLKQKAPSGQKQEKGESKASVNQSLEHTNLSRAEMSGRKNRRPRKKGNKFKPISGAKAVDGIRQRTRHSAK